MAEKANQLNADLDDRKLVNVSLFSSDFSQE